MTVIQGVCKLRQAVVKVRDVDNLSMLAAAQLRDMSSVSREQMEKGVGQRIMSTLQEWGLADDRWRLLNNVSFARQYPYVREDGTTGFLGLCTLLNYVKVKFRNAQMLPAKFYLLLAALEL